MAEYMPQVKKLLDSADLAFDADDFREGSRLMWEATRTAMVAIANNHGWPCGSMDELKEIAYRMDGTGFPWHFGRFSVAMTFRTHRKRLYGKIPNLSGAKRRSEWGANRSKISSPC